MKEPVMIETGHTFEKKAIIEWLKKNNTCPKTRTKIQNKDFMPPNWNLKGLIDQWNQKHPEKKPVSTDASPSLMQNTNPSSYREYMPSNFGNSSHILLASSNQSRQQQLGGSVERRPQDTDNSQQTNDQSRNRVGRRNSQ